MEELLQTSNSIETKAKSKGEFLASVSHEMRTTLHGILSFSRFGVNKLNTASPEKKLYYFEMINQSGHTLLSLLDDLLDLSKMEAGRMNFDFKSSKFLELVNYVVDEFSSLTSEREIAIHLEKPETEIVTSQDQKRIQQVIRNLLSNAIKFSPDKGDIKVSVNITNGNISTSVKDNGKGIPDSELQSVFDQYVQSSANKESSGGTGLGLSICREIIRAHKGRIWAENHSEGGAIFTFEIPQNLDKEEFSSPIEDSKMPA